MEFGRKHTVVGENTSKLFLLLVFLSVRCFWLCFFILLTTCTWRRMLTPSSFRPCFGLYGLWRVSDATVAPAKKNQEHIGSVPLLPFSHRRHRKYCIGVLIVVDGGDSCDDRHADRRRTHQEYRV